MTFRTNQILFICLALCLAMLSCQFLDPGKVDDSKQPPEITKNDNPIQSLFQGVSGLFGKPQNGVSIGGVEPQGFTLVGQLGGSTFTVASKKGYTALGQGPRVVLLDMANPDSPEFAGESEVLSGLVMELVVKDEYAYAATLYGGLNIFDISNPESFRLVSLVEPEMKGCRGLTIHGNFAYLACDPAGLFIINIKDPKKPEIVFQEDKPSGNALSLALIQDRIYMVNMTEYALDIYDVLNPEKPEKVGSFPFSNLPSGKSEAGFISSVRPCGANLCLAAKRDGLVILDVSEPTTPTVIGQVETPVASGLLVDGNTVYLADDTEGVYIIDITDAENPEQTGLIPTEIGGWELSVMELDERGMSIQGKLLYITDPAYGLTVADVSDPASPQRIGAYMTPLPNALTNIRLDGETAFVTGRISGFRTVNIAEPEKPRELFYDDERKNLYSQYPTDLIIRNNLAWITDGNYPFHAYDVSDPNKPVERGALFDEAASDGAFDLVINDGLAYLSGWGLKDAFYPGKGIWVVDIRDPDVLKPVSFVDVANEHWVLTLVNNYLYALDGAMDLDHNGQKEPISLRVFDLSDPTKPVEVNTLPIPEAMTLTPVDMTSDATNLYIHIIPQGVVVYDLSNPQNPKRTNLIPVMGGMPDIWKDGKHLFVGGTTVYDITRPEKPEFDGTLGVLQIFDLAVDKDLVYTVTAFQGMYIFRYD